MDNFRQALKNKRKELVIKIQMDPESTDPNADGAVNEDDLNSDTAPSIEDDADMSGKPDVLNGKELDPQDPEDQNLQEQAAESPQSQFANAMDSMDANENRNPASLKERAQLRMKKIMQSKGNKK